MLENNYITRCNLNHENTMGSLRQMMQLPYTTPKLLSLFMKRSLSATYKLLTRLEREGLVECHFISELRLNLWTVTREGFYVLAAHKRDESLVFRETRVGRISPLTINHELQLQQAHLNATKNGFERWIYGHAIQGQLKKRPDAICICSNGLRWAIELERFPKSKQRIEQIISIFLQEITSKKYDRIAYIAPTEGLAWSLKKLFTSIKDVPVDGCRYVLESKHYNKFEFFSLDSWPIKSV